MQRFLLLLPLILTGCDLGNRDAADVQNNDLVNIAVPVEQAGAPVLIKTTETGAIIPNITRAMINPSDLVVDHNLSFSDQLNKHALILNKIGQVLQQAEANKAAADRDGSLPNYKAAEEDILNSKKALTPYAAANGQANSLISQGYRMNDLSGKICMPDNKCHDIDAMTGVFFFTGNKAGLGEGLLKKAEDNRTEVVKVNGFDLSAFLAILTGKPVDFLSFGVIPAIRDAIIPPTDTGEIAKIVREPLRRPVEIVQEARDSVIPKSDNGELAKAARDPIKCSVGHLWGGCR